MARYVTLWVLSNTHDVMGGSHKKKFILFALPLWVWASLARPEQQQLHKEPWELRMRISAETTSKWIMWQKHVKIVLHRIESTNNDKETWKGRGTSGKRKESSTLFCWLLWIFYDFAKQNSRRGRTGLWVLYFLLFVEWKMRNNFQSTYGFSVRFK